MLKAKVELVIFLEFGAVQSQIRMTKPNQILPYQNTTYVDVRRNICQTLRLTVTSTTPFLFAFYSPTGGSKIAKLGI